MDLSCLVLPDHTPEDFTTAAVRAEAAGLRGLWTYDHLSWQDMRDGPWFSALPLLGAAAAATSRLRLGTAVASPNFRHPVPFAAEVMTLDHVSRGRLDLGVGAGTAAEDASVLGWPQLSPGQRQSRFEEWVLLLRDLLSQPRTDAAGTWYSAVDARTVPGPVQQPLPLVVAAAGARGMRLAARVGTGWMTYGGALGEGVAGLVASFRREAERFSAVQQAVLAEAQEEVDGHGSRRPVRRVALLHRQALPALAHDVVLDVLAALEELGYDEVCLPAPRPDGRAMTQSAFDVVASAR